MDTKLKTSKEFTREEIGEIYNALIVLKDFVKSRVKESELETPERVDEEICNLKRLAEIYKLIKKVDGFMVWLR